MNWDAISAVPEIGATIAVFVTLVYLSIQVRRANKQRELDAYRYAWDTLNQFCDLLTQSTENASILNRGRKSLSNLNEDEYIVFEHIVWRKVKHTFVPVQHLVEGNIAHGD